MKDKNFLTDKNVCVLCMVVCLVSGFVLGAILAPHHNRVEFNLFSGNGNGNRDNFSSLTSGKLGKGRKKHKKA